MLPSYIILAIGVFWYLYLACQKPRDRKNRLPLGRSTAATKVDYSQNARLLGNGKHYTGKYNFYVAVCPRCGVNQEYKGCHQCSKNNIYVKGELSVFSMHKPMLFCRDCWYSHDVATICLNCTAHIDPLFINFYEGSLPLSAPVVMRGRERPDEATVEQLEMPTKVAPVENNFSSLN